MKKNTYICTRKKETNLKQDKLINPICFWYSKFYT